MYFCGQLLKLLLIVNYLPFLQKFSMMCDTIIDQNGLLTDIRGNINSLIYRSDSADKIREALVIIEECLKNNQQKQQDNELQDIEMLFAKGYVYTKLARYVSAIEYYDKCIEVAEKNKPLCDKLCECLNYGYFFKGYALKELERYQDALFWLNKYRTDDITEKKELCLEEAIKKTEKLDLYVLVNKGYLLNRLNRFNDALEFFDKAAECFTEIYNEYTSVISAFDELDNNTSFPIGKLNLILDQYKDITDENNKDKKQALLKLEYIKYYQGSLLFEIRNNPNDFAKYLKKNSDKDKFKGKTEAEAKEIIWEEAKKYLEDCLNINRLLNLHTIPDNEYALSKMHEILFEKNDEKSALLLNKYIPSQEWIKKHIPQLKEEKKDITDNGILKYYYGNRLRLFGNNLAAVKIYDQILSSNSLTTTENSTSENKIEFIKKDDYLALFYIGCAYNGLAKHEKALKCFEKCEEQIDDSDILFAIANTHRRLGKHEKSLEYFDKCIKKDDNDKDAWFHKGNALNELQRYVEAAKCFNKYNEICKEEYHKFTGRPKEEYENRYFFSKMGGTYMGQRKFIEAIECFDKAHNIVLEYEDEEATYNRISALIQLNGKYANLGFFKYEDKDGMKKNGFAENDMEIIEKLIIKNDFKLAKVVQNKDVYNDDKGQTLRLINQQYILFKCINIQIDSIGKTSFNSKKDIINYIQKEKKSKEKELQRLRLISIFNDEWIKKHYEVRKYLLTKLLEHDENFFRTVEKIDDQDVLTFFKERQRKQMIFINDIIFWIQQRKWHKINRINRTIRLNDEGLSIEAYILLKEYELVTYAINFKINKILDVFIEANPYHEDAILNRSLLSIKMNNYKKSLYEIEQYFFVKEFNKKRNENKDIQINPSKEKEAELIRIFLLENSDSNKNNIKFNKSLISNNVDILQLLTLFKNSYKYDEEQTFNIVKEILENDTFFTSALGVKIDNANKYLVDKYKEIYIRSLSIVQKLYINLECEQFVAHYAKKETAEKLLFDNSPFRLSSTGLTNDPKEGETLLEYFNIKQKTYSNKDYSHFIGCFMFDEDCLNQFRLYGKDANKEATGVSLMMKSEFFRDEICGTGNTMFTKYDSKTPEKLALFRCIYIDPDTKKIISIGQREESSFYKTDDQIKQRFIQEGHIQLLQNHLRNKRNYDQQFKKLLDFMIVSEKNRRDKRMERYKEIIQKKQEDIKKEMENLREIIKKNKEILDENVLSELLLNLRYLVKVDSFKEEQECRIIEIVRASNPKVRVESNYMYINYLPPKDYLKKITFGPKAEGFTFFKNRFLTEGLTEIDCRKSEHPIT